MTVPFPPLTLEAVVLDHDGTLVDSEPVHLRIWQSVLAEHGAELSALEYSERLSGIPTIESARYLVASRGLTLSAEALCQRKLSEVSQYLTRAAFPLMTGALELLEDLRGRGLAVAVASGAGRAEVTHSLAIHRLEPFISSVVTGSDVSANKPAPDVYLRALRELGSDGARALAVEDSDTGEASARSAGLFCLRLDTPSRLPREAGTLRVPDLRAVRQWIGGLAEGTYFR